jgi:S1-C subfamily serine protease
MEWTLRYARASTAPATATEAIVWERVTGLGSIARTVPMNSTADRAGLRSGDLIVRAGSVVAPSPAQLAALVRSGADGDNATGVVLLVRRNGIDRVITLTPGR